MTADRQQADRLIALGNAQEDRREFDAALRNYREAVQAAPDYARAHMNIGNALRQLGLLDEALAAMNDAVRCAPADARARFNLGLTLAKANQPAAAERELREALRCESSMAEASVALADLFESAGRTPEAEAALTMALRIRPDYAGATLNLGLLQAKRHRLDAAEATFAQAKTLDPSLAGAHAGLADVYLKTGRAHEAVRALRRALELDPTLRDASSALLFALNFCDDLEAHTVFEEHVKLGARLSPGVVPITSWPNQPEAQRRIKIGYVSADFGQHPVGLFLLPVLERHHRSQVEVHCYSNSKLVDEMTRRLRRAADHWRQIADVDDRSAAEMVLADGIDMLIDLSGHTAGNRLSLFAAHPAPLQATWLGYLNTTGLPGMDYRICDQYTDPHGVAESLSSERLCRLTHSQWCYVPVHEAELAVRPVRPAQSIVFGSFNQFAKISDACLDLWCEILARLPGATLVVMDVPTGNAREALRRRVTARGIDPDRVTPHGRASILEYYSVIAGVDIALDTFPYNGATTTLDTLWMGVPLVALRGDRGIARSGNSIMTSAGLPELIAASPREYVELNLRLATDAAWCNSVRETLRGRLAASPLMDAERFTVDLEARYREMWHEWCARKPTAG